MGLIKIFQIRYLLLIILITNLDGWLFIQYRAYKMGFVFKDNVEVSNLNQSMILAQ